MTIEQQIDAAIVKCEQVASTWADSFIAQVEQGEQPCGEVKLFMLGQWMLILKEYKIYNFGDNGAITPEFVCLTQDEVILLISKINALRC